MLFRRLESWEYAWASSGGLRVNRDRLETISRSIFTDKITRNFIIGALLAASFYFISAGINEILLSNFEQCVQQNERLFFSPNIEEVCRPEWQVLLIKASSRHILGLVFPQIPAILAWLGSSILYALIGGMLSQATPRWSITIFIILHLAMISIVAILMYMSRYIA
jgi:hypothetical protein